VHNNNDIQMMINELLRRIELRPDITLIDLALDCHLPVDEVITLFAEVGIDIRDYEPLK